MALPARKTLADTSLEQLTHLLEGQGLVLDIGATTVRVNSHATVLPAQLQASYPEFPFTGDAEFADLHIRIGPPGGLRRWLRPQVVFRADGTQPFDPFPADSPLPLFEWGANWLIGRRLNDLLLLHAGVVERDGCALVMPAMPGSGKSTLTAALSQRGWRLLSDEFGAYDPEQDAFLALLKPVALKNQSIAVMRTFAPEARFGPEFPKTRKGTVAHMAARSDAVARRKEPAAPGAVVLPRWIEGSPTRLEPIGEDGLFPALAFNAFNYQALGRTGFEAALGLSRRCLGWELFYSDLDDALRALDALWPEVVAHRARHA